MRSSPQIPTAEPKHAIVQVNRKTLLHQTLPLRRSLSRLIVPPYQALGDVSPLQVIVEKPRHPIPLISDAFGLRRAPGHDVGPERPRPDDEALGQVCHVGHDLLPGPGVDRPAEVEGPDQARDAEEERPVRDVDALAQAPPRAEHEVVPLGRVRVGRGLGRGLLVVGPACRVEFPWVWVAFCIVCDSPVV